VLAGLETLASHGSSLMWRGPDQFSLAEGLLFQRVTLPQSSPMENVAQNQMSTAMEL
jgi:hypothetical protein